MKPIIKTMIITSTILLSILLLAGCTGDDPKYSRSSTDPEVRMIYAVVDGMSLKYKAQDPIVSCKEYVTCSSSSQYDYIMNGKISLLNEYGARITYSFSAYIVKNGSQYAVVDSIVY